MNTAALSAPLDRFLTRVKSLGDRIRTDADAIEAASGDESGLPDGIAGAVLKPVSVEEVSLIAREAAALAVPLIGRGGGTGKAGAGIPLGGEVVVDLTLMNKILEFRPQDLYAVVQPGVITRDLDRAANEHGLFYPPDPSSWESSTIGGNIATNAGGPRAVKYGVTQRYVWGLQIVLAGGDVLRVGKHSLKGVVGLDLTSLIVGSEGTLGLVTEATMHVIPAPRAVETAWLDFTDLHAASKAAEKIFQAGLTPRMMELLDPIAIEVVRPKVAFPIDPSAKACLLLEADGDQAAAEADLLRMCEIALEEGALNSIIARSDKDRDNLRRGRRLVSSSLKEKYPWKFSDDISVPRSKIADLLAEAAEGAKKTGVLTAAYGHLGDGNLHVNFLCESKEQRVLAHQVRLDLMRRAVAMGGTMSGEHGIGLTKRDELTLEQSKEVIDLQKRIKKAFDPSNIMNPGKVWPE
ncbi:MAG: FAD-binding protein [Clostridia bacterium]|nr:FAD-binding protein [Deltaproteobacteria bacterium]